VVAVARALWACALWASNPLLPYPASNPLANPMVLMGAMMGMGVMGGALGGGVGGVAVGLGVGSAGDWETHYNDAGRPYCFNSRTQVSQWCNKWDPPMEMAMQQTLGSMMGAAAEPAPGMAMGMSSGFSRGPASSQASIGSGSAPVREFPRLPPLVVPLSTQPTPYIAHLAHRYRLWASAACLQCEVCVTFCLK